MKIGVPQEVKNNEYRVGLTPESVKVLAENNHEVFFQKNAGNGIGYLDSDYINSGAVILDSPKEIFESSELIVKVKEPVPDEFQYLSNKHTLFTYLHLAGDLKQGLGLTSTGVTGIAYETVTSENGSLPLLAPMSAIAGQLSFVVGSYHLLKHNHGKGKAILEGLKLSTKEYVFFQDADLEYDPSEYLKMLTLITSGKADVVYGSRFRGGQAWRLVYYWHSIANRLLTAFSNALTNINFTDIECGYKVFRSDIIRQIELKENHDGALLGAVFST